jgi:DNA-binding NarL/FixJ family response regulator
MQILDSRLAVVRVDPDDSSKGAMFIRVSNLINLLIDLYERLWDEGEPLFPTSSSAPQLSERQHRLVALLASGAKDEAIARALSVGLRTIRRDISDLKMMAGARSRTDLVTAAIRKGWIASPSPPRESTSGIQTLADQRP